MKTIENRIARTLVLVVSLIWSFPVFGQNADAVDLRLASRVGENFIKMSPGIALSGEPGSLRRVETDKFPNLYIFNADEHGFIIVAGDKRVQPILGFSDEGTFNPNDMAPAAEMIIGGYDYVVDSMLRYNVRSTDESVRQAWIDLENGYYGEVNGNREDEPQYPLAYGPLLWTDWEQGDPVCWSGNYNQCCPYFNVVINSNQYNDIHQFCDPDSIHNGSDIYITERALTGCTATVMAQLLYHYRKDLSPIRYSLPFRSNDANTYSLQDADGHIIQSVYDPNQTIYNDHPFVVGGWDYSNPNTMEFVAKMMLDCGLLLGTSYGIEASSASADYLLAYLKNNFGFPKAEKKVRSNYDYDTWIKELKKSISNTMPVCYGGKRMEGNKTISHIYILDGYYTTPNDVLFRHVGIGIYNGYLSLNNCRYNINQECIILAPTPDTINKTINFGDEFRKTIHNKEYVVTYGSTPSVSETQIVYTTPGDYHIHDTYDNSDLFINVKVLPTEINPYRISRTVCKGGHYYKDPVDNQGRIYVFKLSSDSTNFDGTKEFVRYHYDNLTGAVDGECILTLTTEECNNCTPDVSGLNNGTSGSKDGQTNNQIIYESVTKYYEYVNAMKGFMSRVLMEAYWQDDEKEIEFWNLFQSLLDSNTGVISEEGIQQLISQSQLENISDDYIRSIAEGYNQSVLYWNEGYYTNDSLPEGYGGMIEYDTAAMRKAYEAQAYAESLGFSDVRQMYDNAYEMLESEIENQQTSVCARVTVQFTQKMTMTREAFNGTLQIFNGHESIPMQNILVDFRIKDAQGNDCTNLFQINTLSLDQITGISGDGSLAAQTNGTALVQFIPTRNAAPTQPTVYYFGGSFSFIDPFTGEGLTYPLYPVDITVNPSPDLYVDYFMQRDILGDDALTLGVIEPSIPAELGVIIHNKGAGIAKNVTLETAEPEIIDNEHGLAIEFAMYGASFNGSPRQLGLMEIPFGNIESGQTAVGEWLFTSSLLGHFVSYTAHVIHNSSYDNPDLSLVSHLDIHELVHPIYAYGNLDDGINDFLVNDNPDAYDTPDSIYFSHGGKTSVGVVDNISFDHYVSPSDTIVTLTVVPSRIGWNYGVTDDPGMNQYNIVSCIRNNDNQVIPLNNVWLTFVTIPDGGDPVYENKLHIVDTVSSVETVSYTLTYSVAPPEPSNVPIGAIDGLFSVSDSQQVYFSKGNLQYQATTNTWRFAENQWDCQRLENRNISLTYDGWIDLFCWGTSGYDHGAVCYQPWSTSQSSSDYYAYGSFEYNLYDQTGQADWGYNAISNGGNALNQWRTLTKDEWSYLFFDRDTPSGIRYAKAIVNNVEGLVVLPDNWDSTYYSLNETDSIPVSFSTNIITENDWLNILEPHGVLFLPAGSYRSGTYVENINPFRGYYWASSYSNQSRADHVEFNDFTFYYVRTRARNHGLSVRLVRTAQGNGTYTINTTCSPANGGTVTGGGTYQQGQTCTLTAIANNGYTFTNWTENGNVVSTNACYTITVTANRNLVANFIQNNVPTGAINGIFSVSNSRQVYFSHGNLQYQATTNTWRFAEHQWDCFRLENANISSSYDGWIDLFGWGTSGYNHGATCYQPWSTSGNYSDYYAYGSSEYNLYDQTGKADWGYNAISNGGNTENQWRTLTSDEWSYLIFNRETPSGIRFAKAVVNNMEGLVVLPDNWDSSIYSLQNTNTVSATYTSNIITENDWVSVFEPHGVLFLPAGSYRNGSSYIENSNKGYYWASTYSNQNQAGYFEFNNIQDESIGLFVSNRWRNHGLSVRLARTIQYTINTTCLPTEGGTVIGAGTYNSGETCSLTATANNGYSFVNWTKNGEQVSTDATYSFTVTEDASFVANFRNALHFTIAGTWSTASNWQGGILPGANDEVFIDAPCQLDQNATVFALTVSDGQSLTLQSGQTLIVTNTLTNTSTTGLVIEDGAQLEHASNNVSAMVKKYIAGHGTNNGKFHLISNPLASTINPELASIYYLTRGNYDLYNWLACAPDHLEWRNFKDDSFMMYAGGYGYLYANQNGMELNFPGTLLPSKYRFGKSVNYDDNNTEHPGWNLIGNPFVCNAYLVNENNEPLPFYRMNTAGNDLEAVSSGAIAPMEGVFYQASENGTVYFIRTDNTSQIPTSCTISVSTRPYEGGTVSGGGTFMQGQSCTVQVTPASGYEFMNWTENGVVVSTNSIYTFTVNDSRNLVANFSMPYVDLGLPSGLLWANCNVGADNPEDYGDYFAWGETQPKDTYNWNTYQYCMGSNNTLTKYCSNSSYGYNGFTDNLTTLLPEDDAATANWGNGWRMPTKEEWQELYQNTTHTWTTQNGVNGRLFTASNGNSLFLPAAGYRSGSSLPNAGSLGHYWSSSLNTGNPSLAWYLYFSSGGCHVSNYYRYYGRSVRPVRSSGQN